MSNSSLAYKTKNEPLFLKIEDEITAWDFLNLTDEDKLNIRNVDIQLPKLGTPGFGKIIVTYRFPVFRQVHVRKLTPA